jgi:predicted acetyltransferase
MQVCLMDLTVIDCVTLTQVPVSQRAIITNLIQLYKYDFSEFAQIGSPYGEVGSDGRFVYDGLDSYWREEDRIPLTIQADGRLAGFILMNRWSALNRELDHSVGEFFVLRNYRRVGVGSRAAKLLFERWPGRWEVGVASYNKPAQCFWRKAIAASVDSTVEECAGDGKRWVGPVLCFDNRVRKT